MYLDFRHLEQNKQLLAQRQFCSLYAFMMVLLSERLAPQDPDGHRRWCARFEDLCNWSLTRDGAVEIKPRKEGHPDEETYLQYTEEAVDRFLHYRRAEIEQAATDYANERRSILKDEVFLAQLESTEPFAKLRVFDGSWGSVLFRGFTFLGLVVDFVNDGRPPTVCTAGRVSTHVELPLWYFDEGLPVPGPNPATTPPDSVTPAAGPEAADKVGPEVASAS